MHARLRPLVLSATLAASLAASAVAHAGEVTGRAAAQTANGATAAARPGEVVVRFEHGTTARAMRRAADAVGADRPRVAGPSTRLLRLEDRGRVDAAVAELEGRPEVVSAVPNLLGRASASARRTADGYFPNDPGRGSGWTGVQWNFLAEHGVNAPKAWDNVHRLDRSPGKGVVVAVIDSGVAYSDRGPYRRSPDFAKSAFVRGYDFLSRDPYANDTSGHGTHIAGTIAERTNNGVGVTGLAYRARIMPLRVLDANGYGDSDDMARAVRFAARKGADVINLSIEFDRSIRARDIPHLLDAFEYARKKGVLIVAATGNDELDEIPYPARSRHTVAVGATTKRGCIAEYSNHGRYLDLVAPGGGADARIDGDPNCTVFEDGPDVLQMTFGDSLRRFGLVGGYRGTSMAAPHVSAAAALIIGSGILGDDPSPGQVEQHLERTARDRGPVGYDRRYGHGLLDAAAATASLPPR